MGDAPNYKLAEVDYIAGMKYKDIADKYNVTMNTVKSWKKRYAWNRKRVHTKPIKVCTQNKKGAPIAKEATAEDIDQIVSNTALTDQQQLFCLQYVKYFNATKAYQKAYPDVSYQTAMANGYRLMQKAGIKAAINQLKQNKLNREMFKEEDLFQMYLDIARADMVDFASVKDGYVEVHNSDKLDGQLIQELSQGKEGAKIKLLDKSKAMQWLSDHMDMATEEQRARINMLRSKTQLDETEDLEDDGFIDALNASAKEEWTDEEN